jgi:hypothetical protein
MFKQGDIVEFTTNLGLRYGVVISYNNDVGRWLVMCNGVAWHLEGRWLEKVNINE